MKQEKLNKFITLIDCALEIAENRKEKLKTKEYRQFRIEKALKYATPERQKELLKDQNIEEILDFSFGYEALDKFISNLNAIKENVQNGLHDERLKLPKGKRPIFGLTRAISECGDSFGESLYNEELGNALFAVEQYYKNELD